MPEINRQTNTSNMIWQLIDRETGAENAGITWAFRVGDRIKIRLANEMDQDHPMHHPFHIHGAGRFLILSRDGEPGGELRLEGHGASTRRPDDRHPARRDQSGAVDGSLPHRRAHREQDDGAKKDSTTWPHPPAGGAKGGGASGRKRWTFLA